MYRVWIVVIVAVLLVTGARVHAQSGVMPPLPVTQLDVPRTDPALDRQRITLGFARRTPIHDVLLLLVRETNLSVIPDPSLTQTFVGELKNVTLREAFDLILEPLGLDYSVRGTVVRVFSRELETRLYSVDYVLTQRSQIHAAQPESPDLYRDLSDGVRTLLSEQGRMNLDRTASLLQVTDTSVRLARVEAYLEAVMLRVTRQVQIEGKIVEVELRDEFAGGIDWRAIQRSLANSGASSQAPAPVTSEGVALALKPNGFTALMTALAAQGTVNVLSSPLIAAMNNEPAVMRLASGDPATQAGSLSLRVTPQISADGIIHLSVNPVVSAREADTLVRVRQGETIVIAGLLQEHPSADAPGMSRRKTDLVILLTPTLMGPARAR